MFLTVWLIITEIRCIVFSISSRNLFIMQMRSRIDNNIQMSQTGHVCDYTRLFLQKAVTRLRKSTNCNVMIVCLTPKRRLQAIKINLFN